MTVSAEPTQPLESGPSASEVRQGGGRGRWTWRAGSVDVERLSGTDALMWHMERPDTPLHTLKIAILDPSRRGQVTLDELALAVGSRLGIVRRATQRVVAAPGFGGLPYWVDDPDFAIRRHIDEVTLPALGSSRELDDLCSELATRHLARDRSPWSMTLVHGLDRGRQAVVVRVHHAVTDGLGALNTLLACTSENRGEVPPVTPPAVADDVVVEDLARAATREAPALFTGFFRLLRDGLASRGRAKAFRQAHPDLPPFMGVERNPFNVRSGAERICASGSVPLAVMRAVGKATDATVNGVLHAVIAGAIRDELSDRGHPVNEPSVAVFGIASDKSSERTGGNFITPTTVLLASHLADPLERLSVTARSCREGVELRKTTGLDMTARWAVYGPRLVASLRAGFANRKRTVVNHVNTANVAGPKTSRWIGDIEVVDWFSYAVAVSPSNVNITVYSYDGRVNIGLVTTPEAMPDPHGFLARMETELNLLVTCTAAEIAA